MKHIYIFFHNYSNATRLYYYILLNMCSSYQLFKNGAVRDKYIELTSGTRWMLLLLFITEQIPKESTVVI